MLKNYLLQSNRKWIINPHKIAIQRRYGSCIAEDDIARLSQQIIDTKFHSSDQIKQTAQRFKLITDKIHNNTSLNRFLWSYYMYNKSFPSQVCHLVSRIQSNSDHLFRSVIDFEKLLNKNICDESSIYYKNRNLSSMVSLNVLTTTIAQQIFMAAIDEFVDSENNDKSHRELGYELLMSFNKICINDDGTFNELTIMEENRLIMHVIDPLSELIKNGYKTRINDDDITINDIYRAIGFHCASEYFGSIEMSTIYNNLLINNKQFQHLLNDKRFDGNWISIHAKSEDDMDFCGNVEEEHFKYSTNAASHLLYYLKDGQTKIFLDLMDESINEFCDVLDFFIEKTDEILIDKSAKYK